MTHKINTISFSTNCALPSFLSVSTLKSITLSGSYLLEESAPYLLLLSRKGSGQFMINKKQRILLPDNCAYFCRSEENITLRPTSPTWDITLLSLSGGLCSLFLTQFPSVFENACLLSSATTIWTSIEKLMQTSEFLLDTADILRFKLLTDIFTELCIQDQELSPSISTFPPYVVALKSAIDTDYPHEFSLEKYEFILKISKYRLCREFSRCYKISPLQYLNHVRLEHAKNLLLTTDLTVKEVGSSVGIHNTNHFINLFKRKTGHTPQVFRKETNHSIALLHYPYTPDAPL